MISVKDYVERILQPVFTALSVFPTITQQTVRRITLSKITNTVFLRICISVFLPVGQFIFVRLDGLQLRRLATLGLSTSTRRRSSSAREEPRSLLLTLPSSDSGSTQPPCSHQTARGNHLLPMTYLPAYYLLTYLILTFFHLI